MFQMLSSKKLRRPGFGRTLVWQTPLLVTLHCWLLCIHPSRRVRLAVPVSFFLSVYYLFFPVGGQQLQLLLQRLRASPHPLVGPLVDFINVGVLLRLRHHAVQNGRVKGVRGERPTCDRQAEQPQALRLGR